MKKINTSFTWAWIFAKQTLYIYFFHEFKSLMSNKIPNQRMIFKNFFVVSLLSMKLTRGEILRKSYPLN